MLVLIGIIASAIIPHLGGSIPAWQVRQEAKSILAAMRFCRRVALEEQEIMVFVVDADEGIFAVEDIDGFVNSNKSAERKFSVRRRFSVTAVKLVQLDGFELIGNKKGLIFWPDGRTKRAQIELAIDEDSKSGRWRILIDDNGRFDIREVFKNE